MEILEEVKLKEDLQLPDIEVPIFILRFLYHLKGKGRAYGTYVRYGYYLVEFVKWLKKRKKQEINVEVWIGLLKEDYNEYYKTLINKHHYSMESIKRVESVLMQLYLYLIELGHNDVVVPSLSIEITQFLKKVPEKEFVSEQDFEKLVKVMKSYEGLTEHQLKGRNLLIRRNVCIVTLFYKYGLTMSELVSLTMKDVNLGRYKAIEIKGKTGEKRILSLGPDDGLIIVDYLKDIPKPVRPKSHTDDPLFVAFDYQRLTYRWVYDDDDKIDNGQPKALSRLAVQKMILQEVKRAGLDSKGISSQTMRNSAILAAIQEGKSEEEIMSFFGLITPLTLRRYKEYIKDS